MEGLKEFIQLVIIFSIGAGAVLIISIILPILSLLGATFLIGIILYIGIKGSCD